MVHGGTGGTEGERKKNEVKKKTHLPLCPHTHPPEGGGGKVLVVQLLGGKSPGEEMAFSGERGATVSAAGSRVDGAAASRRGNRRSRAGFEFFLESRHAATVTASLP